RPLGVLLNQLYGAEGFLRQRLPVADDGAHRWLYVSRKYASQRCFSCSRVPLQAEDLTTLQLKADILEHAIAQGCPDEPAWHRVTQCGRPLNHRFFPLHRPRSSRSATASQNSLAGCTRQSCSE